MFDVDKYKSIIRSTGNKSRETPFIKREIVTDICVPIL